MDLPSICRKYSPRQAASVGDKYSIGPSIGPSCTRCWFIMIIVIQVCSNFHRARVFIINTRPDETSNAGGVSRGLMNTRAQSKLQHPWIILVIVKQHLVQVGRMDGLTKPHTQAERVGDGCRCALRMLDRETLQHHAIPPHSLVCRGGTPGSY